MQASDRPEHSPEPQEPHDPSNQEKSTFEATQPTKTVSPAKVAANRRNAQKSTGPKTQAGKDRSRWNAVQHGLLAQRLFTPQTVDRDRWIHLLDSLQQDFQPEGTLEQMLVEKIAVGYFRLHMAYGHEAEFASTAKGFFYTMDRTGRYTASINRQLTQDMNQLERLQRQRKGQFVPAPVSIDVNVHLGNEAAQEDIPLDSHAMIAPLGNADDLGEFIAEQQTSATIAATSDDGPISLHNSPEGPFDPGLLVSNSCFDGGRDREAEQSIQANEKFPNEATD